MSEERSRAAKAQSELSITREVLNTLRASAFEKIAASSSNETLFRENLYRTVQVVDALTKHLQGIVDAGKVEEFADAIREQSAA